MVESELISEVILNGAHDVTALRVDRTQYPIWAGAPGLRHKCRVDDLVIKFDMGKDGQSAKEGRFATKVQVPDRKYFVEVTHAGCAKDSLKREWFWVAQPYVDAVANTPVNEREVITKASKKLAELCNTYSISDIGGYGHNWTIVNGEPLIYDCGFGEGGTKRFRKT